MKTIECGNCGKEVGVDKVDAVGVGNPNNPKTEFWCRECYNKL